MALGQKLTFSGCLGLFKLSSCSLWDSGWPCRAGLTRARSSDIGWGRGLVAWLKRSEIRAGLPSKVQGKA